MEIESSSISLLSNSDATSSRLEPGAAEESNGTASPTSPRLANLTGLLMSHKPPPKCTNSTSSEDTTAPSSAISPPPSVANLDPPSLVRTARFVDDEATTDPPLRRTGSFGAGVATGGSLPRRLGQAAAASSAGGKGPSAAGISDSDLRRFVFHHPRAKRMVSGLRVRAFSRQAFVSSFTVGLALGSVVAIVLKILSDLALRMLYN